MNPNQHHWSMENLQRYLATPSNLRPLATYREDLLNPATAFDVPEIERLLEIVNLRQPTYPKSRVSKLLIDLSWASSCLEGNTYTQLDTQALIEYGEVSAGKPAEDAAMILNHKRAIEIMLASPSADSRTVLKIHAHLADSRTALESRHFLPPDKCGVVRSYTPNGLEIDGSSYLPPQAEDRPHQFLDGEFERLLSSSSKIPDPINQSFFLLTRLPYLQAFYDANKRTARIICNIPLVANALSPISFVGFEKARYLQGMIAFYELGDIRLARDGYLDAFLCSAFRYLPFAERERVEIFADQPRHLEEARRYVIEGVRETDPVWLRTFDGWSATESSGAASSAQTRQRPRTDMA